MKKPVEPELPAPHEFQHLVSVRKVGDNGLDQIVTASAQELVKIAAFLGLVQLDKLRAAFTLYRWQAKGIRLTGRLEADVVQTCVVTLEPVSAHIDETFERKFLPKEVLGGSHEQSDVFVDPIAEDPPELLGQEIDLGEVLVEELALNLNPYPRREGQAFDEIAGELGVKRENPFAVLSKLKARLEQKK